MVNWFKRSTERLKTSYLRWCLVQAGTSGEMDRLALCLHCVTLNTITLHCCSILDTVQLYWASLDRLSAAGSLIRPEHDWDFAAFPHHHHHHRHHHHSLIMLERDCTAGHCNAIKWGCSTELQLTKTSRRENGGAYSEDVFGGKWMVSKGKMIQFICSV